MARFLTFNKFIQKYYYPNELEKEAIKCVTIFNFFVTYVLGILCTIIGFLCQNNICEKQFGPLNFVLSGFGLGIIFISTISTIFLIIIMTKHLQFQKSVGYIYLIEIILVIIIVVVGIIYLKLINQIYGCAFVGVSIGIFVGSLFNNNIILGINEEFI